MRLLDLFCGAGGCSVGYARAGFDEIVGVDIAPQPRYPYELIVADALDVLADCEFLAGFDVVHASPPCQAFTSMSVMPNAREHRDLLTPTRERLRDLGKPYVIENVPGSPIDVRPVDLLGGGGGIVLCGSMFDLRTDEYELRRHRWFESNIELPQPPCRHSGRTVVGFYGDHARTRRRSRKLHNKDAGGDIVGTAKKLALVDALMGIDWMAWSEANQAVPPAYCEFIGARLIEHLSALEVAS